MRRSIFTYMNIISFVNLKLIHIISLNFLLVMAKPAYFDRLVRPYSDFSWSKTDPPEISEVNDEIKVDSRRKNKYDVLTLIGCIRFHALDFHRCSYEEKRSFNIPAI